MNTRAAVLHSMGLERPYNISQPLKIENVNLDPPGLNEVIIQIKAAGLCHSDLSVIDGNRPRPLPMVLGHEASGIVVEKGRSVKKLDIGDHVVFSFLPSCGFCSYCKSGKAALCEPGNIANANGTLLSGDRKISYNSKYYNHHLGVSGFSEFSVATEESLIKIEKDLPFDIAALFGCAVITGVGAVINSAEFKFGETLLVIGLGGVGLSAILGAKAAGASKIIAADINAKKGSLAKSFGADIFIDSSDNDSYKKIHDITNGGVDTALEFAGAVSAINFAFKSTKKGGKTITAGLPNPKSLLEISPVELVGQEKTIKGSYLGGSIPSRDIISYMNLYRAGKLPVDKLISHKIKLNEINQGFERLAKGEGIRQIIIF